jgi:hypothetical protein
MPHGVPGRCPAQQTQPQAKAGHQNWPSAGTGDRHGRAHPVCQPGQYAVNAAARITLPDGYVVQGSLHDTSATVTFSASDCGGGGGGGGGGCATATPSVSGQPGARLPDLIVCQ